MAKKELHPKYFKAAKVTCACGNTFTTGSTKDELTVEVCSACHPFYTGEEKFIDTEGRVERFERKRKEAEKAKVKRQKEKETKEKEEVKRPRTLKELLEAM